MEAEFDCAQRTAREPCKRWINRYRAKARDAMGPACFSGIDAGAVLLIGVGFGVLIGLAISNALNKNPGW